MAAVLDSSGLEHGTGFLVTEKERIRSVRCAPETKRMLYVTYTSIKKKSLKKRQEKHLFRWGTERNVTGIANVIAVI